MKFSTVAAALASASAAYAHSHIYAVHINGVDQGDGRNQYIRSAPNNNPVKDLSSSSVACNVNNVAVPKTLEVASGDQITFEWYHDNRADDIMDKSHVGPAQVYVAPTSSNGAGAVWAKLFSQGYTDDWATNKVINAKGMVTVTVPDLEAGEYLFRPEFVTLHEADAQFAVNPARGVQLYMECIQFKITSSGSKTITDGIDFKTSYTSTDPGLFFNVYGSDPKSYVAPGGAISSISAGGSIGLPAAGSKPSTTAAAPSTTAAAPTSTAAAPTTTAAVPTTTEAAVPTSVSTTRASIPTSKMTTVTIRSSSTVAAPSATAPVETPSASSCPTAPSTGNSGATVAKWYQCGGINYTGSTNCVSGTTCTVQNPYYSQCL